MPSMELVLSVSTGCMCMLMKYKRLSFYTCLSHQQGFMFFVGECCEVTNLNAWDGAEPPAYIVSESLCYRMSFEWHDIIITRIFPSYLVYFLSPQELPGAFSCYLILHQYKCTTSRLASRPHSCYRATAWIHTFDIHTNAVPFVAAPNL
jgi:hypothetical protein